MLLNDHELEIFPINNNKYKSDIWNYFDILGIKDIDGEIINNTQIEGYVACKSCRKVFQHKKSSGTQALVNHHKKSCKMNNQSKYDESSIPTEAKEIITNSCIEFIYNNIRFR